MKNIVLFLTIIFTGSLIFASNGVSADKSIDHVIKAKNIEEIKSIVLND